MTRDSLTRRETLHRVGAATAASLGAGLAGCSSQQSSNGDTPTTTPATTTSSGLHKVSMPVSVTNKHEKAVTVTSSTVLRGPQRLKLRGVLKIKSVRKLFGVAEISVKFYDDAGVELGSRSAILRDLTKGAKKEFSVGVRGEDASRIAKCEIVIKQ